MRFFRNRFTIIWGWVGAVALMLGMGLAFPTTAARRRYRSDRYGRAVGSAPGAGHAHRDDLQTRQSLSFFPSDSTSVWWGSIRNRPKSLFFWPFGPGFPM